MSCCSFAISSQTQTSSGSPHVGQIPAILDLVLFPHDGVDAGNLLAQGVHSTGTLAAALGGDFAALDEELVLELAQLLDALLFVECADLFGLERGCHVCSSFTRRLRRVWVRQPERARPSGLPP